MLCEYDRFIDKYVDGIGDVFVDGFLSISKLLGLDRVIIFRMIDRIFEYYYGDNLFYINDRHVQLVYSLICSSKPNAFIYLPMGFKGVRSYDEFYLVKDDVFDNYDIQFNDFVNLSNGKNIELVKNTSINDNNVIRLNSADIVLPLRIRTRLDGDRMFVKNMNGSKKIKDIFIDCKVSMRDRNMWPIVLDSASNIVWLPGLKKSKFDREIGEECDIILRYY
jgi:tRNA(Ile)-lysidine synthase